MLRGKTFGKAGQMARLLRFLVEKRWSGESGRLKETDIGTAVFGWEAGYDPKADSIVRVEATRLRKKLAQYYEGEGAEDAVWIRLPTGKYEVEFVGCPVAEPVAVPAVEAPAQGKRSRCVS